MRDHMYEESSMIPTDAESDIASARPEYGDCNVDDFPGGLRACVEAILMACEQPQEAQDIARVLAVDEAEVVGVLERLQEEFAGSSDPEVRSRGFALHHSARGWQFVSRPEFETIVAAFLTDKQSSHLSQAALEALAVIAYKQPVTRAQVSAIRGVNSDGVIRSLSVRGLIHENGIDADSRAALLVTTDQFLENMGLQSLDNLPSLAPFLPSVNSALDDVLHENE